MSRLRLLLGWLVLAVLAGTPALAQSCDTAADMDITTKASLDQAAQQLFAMSTRADYAGLRAQAIASLASNFSGIEAAITEHQKDLQGAHATPSGMFLLDATANQTLERAEFYCGIFNSPDRVTIVLRNLPHGPSAIPLSPLLFAGQLAWHWGGWQAMRRYNREQ